MLIPHYINQYYPFIRGYYIDNLDVCDKLIEYHTNSELKKPGVTIQGTNADAKISTDCPLEYCDLSEEYFAELFNCTMEYCNEYPHAGKLGPFWNLKQPAQIQKYNPGEFYKSFHCERSLSTATRHLVFLTYLNDLDDNGETEFLYQELKVKPEKGLTLIWPADWTFTHRGLVSLTETKYIITGWFDYMPFPDRPDDFQSLGDLISKVQ